MDSIGDYILFRNYLKALKQSPRYAHSQITLVGNIIWRELAEFFDKTELDSCIWIDRKKFIRNLAYRYKTLKTIYELGFQTVIESEFSHEILFGDAIVHASCALETIGSIIAKDKPGGWKNRLLSTSFFTTLINMQDGLTFEFNRNKEFFNKLLQTETITAKLELDTTAVPLKMMLPKEYIVIVPGAQHEFRQWAIQHFAFTISHFLNSTGYHIVVCGSAAENPIALQLLSLCNSSRVVNTTGKITLPEFAKIIAGAKTVITNETSAVHFAAAVKTPFVCISNGHDFGRFHPYPKDIFTQGAFLYPFQIDEQYARIADELKRLQGKAKYNINNVLPETVIQTAEKFL
ncbi:MAG: glycosyltransferase family 9 protein [Ignavibacteriales bacterium]|nr:glycosyltransferase family 9 protein [Ignavibacteriales bacterium]